jgi:uncharacterized protein involved in outer membrane biogenesis
LRIASPGLDVTRKPTAGRGQLWLKILFGSLVAVLVAVAIASYYAGRIARKHLVDAIEKHYQAKVELKDFTVVIFPRIVIHGEGLVMRQGGRTDVPPFISIEKFTTDAGILDLLRKKKRIRSVTLDGLQIHIARRDKSQEKPEDQPKKNVPDFVIDEVNADGTKLTIIPKDPKKDPMVWDIQKLHLKSAGSYSSMDYKATLTNATPPGLIHSQGRFGPFNTDDTGKTPLAGKYEFRDADLSVFKGISGKLASDGRFTGSLENIAVDGTTDVPDFQVRDSGHPVDLKTQFHAIVDGTNGDTSLEPVNVSFLKSQMVARGKVEGLPGRQGKSITLQVDAPKARVEDLIMLVIKSNEPPLTGDARLHTNFILSPGKGDILDRLKLKGQFGLEQTKFAKNSLQEKIAKLSQKGQGKDEPIPPSDTASNFHGTFALDNGLARFSQLKFDVPGATVNLAGSFNVDSEALDFHGHLVMDATLSQMTSGAKSFFARLIQPLVTKNNNTVVPIKITGTRQDPKYGVEIGKLLKRE